MEKKNNTKIIIVLIIFGIAFVSLSAFFLIRNNSKDTNKENNSNSIDDPYNPNDVVIDEFTYSILKLETSNNNLVYSPLSIKYALSMLSEGAKGETKEEIDKLIKDLTLTKYDDIENVLSLANSVFIRDIYKDKVNELFTNTLKEKYNAEVIYDKFKNASNVNKWIEDKTFNIIKNMLKDEQVQDEDVKMLLINALAIDMEWQNKFESENTNSRPFKNGDKELNVAMMHKTSEIDNYYKDDEFIALSIPFKEYNGTNLEFIAIMPTENSLKEILTSNNMNQTISSIVDKMHKPNNQELSISLPRFEFEYKASLKNDLQTMGISKAFSSDADFSNISNTGLYVSEVLHKANIKCSEKGVKAAAATVIMMKDSAFFDPDPKEIVYLNFDKPFMFIIRDQDTKEVWFTGTVYEPKLWDDVKSDYDYQ